MPFGKHKGEKMINVPAGYLLFIFDQDWISEWPDVDQYIKENYDVILSENKTPPRPDTDYD